MYELNFTNLRFKHIFLSITKKEGLCILLRKSKTN